MKFNELPIEFKRVVSYMAYERGHSAGEDEVRAIAEELAADLLPAIEEFKKNLLTTDNQSAILRT